MRKVTLAARCADGSSSEIRAAPCHYVFAACSEAMLRVLWLSDELEALLDSARHKRKGETSCASTLVG